MGEERTGEDNLKEEELSVQHITKTRKITMIITMKQKRGPKKTQTHTHTILHLSEIITEPFYVHENVIVLQSLLTLLVQFIQFVLLSE